MTVFVATWLVGAALAFYLGERNARLAGEPLSDSFDYVSVTCMCLLLWPLSLLMLAITYLEGDEDA